MTTALPNSARKAAAEGIRTLTGLSPAAAHNVVDSGDTSRFTGPVRDQVDRLLQDFAGKTTSLDAFWDLLAASCDGFVRNPDGLHTVHRAGMHAPIELSAADRPTGSDGTNDDVFDRTHLLVDYRDHAKPGSDNLLTVFHRPTAGEPDLDWAVGVTADGTLLTDRWEGDDPHLFIGGASGSGKSVALDSLLLQMMHNNVPDDVTFSIADPKGDLAHFEPAEHVREYIGKGMREFERNPRRELARLLTSTRNEMRRRHNLFLEHPRQPQNLTQARRTAQEETEATRKGTTPPRWPTTLPFPWWDSGPDNHPLNLPFHFVVIDLCESFFADPSNNNHRGDHGTVLSHIEDLARLARSAGIFIISTTAYPSKKNVPVTLLAQSRRVGFPVPNTASSELIIGRPGLETFHTPGRGHLSRSPETLHEFKTFLVRVPNRHNPDIPDDRAHIQTRSIPPAQPETLVVARWNDSHGSRIPVDLNRDCPDPYRATRKVRTVIDAAVEQVGHRPYSLPLHVADIPLTFNAATTGPAIIRTSKHGINLPLRDVAVPAAIQAAAAGTHVHLVEWGTTFAMDPRLRHDHITIYDTVHQWKHAMAGPHDDGVNDHTHAQLDAAVASFTAELNRRVTSLNGHPNPSLHPRDVAALIGNEEPWWDNNPDQHPFNWDPHLLIIALTEPLGQLDDFVLNVGPALGMYTLIVAPKIRNPQLPHGTISHG